METTKTMDAFGDTKFKKMFPEEAEKAEKLDKDLKGALRTSNSAKERRKAAYNAGKSAKQLADDILKKDKILKLPTKFILTDEIKQRLINNKVFYLNDSVLRPFNAKAVCTNCGRKFIKGDIFIEDDNGGVFSCLDEANPEIEIDNEKFSLRIQE